ncbi:MAG: hypothetical protein SGI77_24160 [Pirellulaceae bacterium]|nr:hypothetical protein [Pirellulaceae bacterium]
MSLSNISLPLAKCELPSEVQAFILEAVRRVEAFMATRHTPVVGFYPSCFEMVYRALFEISERRLSAGNAFCEWGSGFGVTASLAAMLGFDSYGIEIDPELYEVSESLAEQFGIPVTFIMGSFIPAGSDRIIDRAYTNFDGDLMLTPHSDATYENLGLEVGDFDLIFAYPWPKDAKLTASLFDRFASSDALLLTYNGLESMRLQRKR